MYIPSSPPAASAGAVIFVLLFAFTIVAVVSYSSVRKRLGRWISQLHFASFSVHRGRLSTWIASNVTMVTTVSPPPLLPLSPFQILKAQVLLSCGTERTAKFPPRILFRHLYPDHHRRGSYDRIRNFCHRPSPLRQERYAKVPLVPLCPDSSSVLQQKDIVRWISSKGSNCAPAQDGYSYARAKRSTLNRRTSGAKKTAEVLKTVQENNNGKPGYSKDGYIWGSVVHSVSRPQKEQQKGQKEHKEKRRSTSSRLDKENLPAH